MVRPSSFHAPGLDYRTDALIRRILRKWTTNQADNKPVARAKKKK